MKNYRIIIKLGLDKNDKECFTVIFINNVANVQTAEMLLNPKMVKGLEYSIYEVLEKSTGSIVLKEQFIKTHYKED